MDPEITFSEFKLAISEGRLEDAAKYATSLLDWLNRGGFEPADFPEHGRIWLEAYTQNAGRLGNSNPDLRDQPWN